MPTVLISSLSYSSGTAIARNLASKIDYEFVGDELLREASVKYGIEKRKLEAAFRSMPLLFGMSTARRKRRIAFAQATLTEKLLDDNIVYHGPFGQFMVKGISHVLSVRIHARLDDRIAERTRRENIDRREAERAISKEDQQRRMIAKTVFGKDDDETDYFDLAINTSQMDVDTAVEVIFETVNRRRYLPMTYSMQRMRDVALTSKALAELTDIDPDVEVEAENGNIQVRTRMQGGARKRTRREEEIKKRLSGWDEVENLEVTVIHVVLDRIKASLR